MKQSFTYKQKFSYTLLIPAVAFIALAAYCYISPFGLAFKNFHLLSYPTSLYTFCGAALLFLVYFTYEYLKYSKSQANPNPITIYNNTISFPKGANEDITVNLLEAKELWNKEDKDNGESMIIYTNQNDRHEFFAENFESLSQFAEFKKALELRCTNITNRS